jgi:hypothetical protein
MAGAAGNVGSFVISTRMKTVMAVSMFLGTVGFALALSTDSKRAWMAFLIPCFYFFSLAMGGMFFTAIQHVTKAGWSVNIRRICEGFTAFLPYAAVAVALLMIGAPELYKWLNPEIVAKDALIQHKTPYLNQTFFIIRVVLFFGLWLWFRRSIIGDSLKQDQSGDENITHGLVGKSIAFVLIFALSYSLFSVDLLMSLEPHWFSTIFGVYAFAGMFQSTMAFMILTILYMKSKGLLGNYVTADHIHDLGKFLFAFTVFWAYIAFSQYMLIWYANLPEETIFIIPRTEHGWLGISIALLIGKFIVPFLALLPRWAKRTPAHLAAVSILILVMQYVDLYWLAYPSMYEESPKFGYQEVTIFLGFFGLFLWAITKFFSSHSLVPLKDPRIHESMHHHVTY